jgi:LacI family transcriptional regulator
MSTISDVAKRAGVSTMTVSRVINHSGYISQDTLERVEKAIADLGFVPNALARSLRFKQTKTIALVLTDITNPFFTTVARGVEDASSENGFTVMFCNTDESEAEEAENLNTLLQKQVDGVLLVPAGSSNESINYLQERNIPVVVLDRRVPDVKVDTVRCDSIPGAFEMTQHLLDLGHRRIGLISGPMKISTSEDRVTGYLQAMHAAGIEIDPEWIHYGLFTQTSGYQLAQKLIKLKPRPTAIVAGNNFIAIGAYAALREAGLHIPNDISLVTFDDLHSRLVLEPFLTTVDQPAYEMGYEATRLLLEYMSMSEVLVLMEGIEKSFPGVHALSQCQFELRAGEVHALVGENGAGKSTLMKILTGIYQKDAGRILYKGKKSISPTRALRNTWASASSTRNST